MGSGTCSAPSDAGLRQCDRSGDGRRGRRPAAVASAACAAVTVVAPVSARSPFAVCSGCGIARAWNATPVISAPPAPYSQSAYVDHEDRAAARRSETGLSLRWAYGPNAMKPGFHCVRTHWIRGFITFQLARRTRTVLLVVPA